MSKGKRIGEEMKKANDVQHPANKIFQINRSQKMGKSHKFLPQLENKPTNLPQAQQIVYYLSYTLLTVIVWEFDF